MSEEPLLSVQPDAIHIRTKWFATLTNKSLTARRGH
jgi:hypothetical protein